MAEVPHRSESACYDLYLQAENITSSGLKTALCGLRERQRMTPEHFCGRQASLAVEWSLYWLLRIVRIYSRLPRPSVAVEDETLKAAGVAGAVKHVKSWWPGGIAKGLPLLISGVCASLNTER